MHRRHGVQTKWNHGELHDVVDTICSEKILQAVVEGYVRARKKSGTCRRTARRKIDAITRE